MNLSLNESYRQKLRSEEKPTMKGYTTYKL